MFKVLKTLIGILLPKTKNKEDPIDRIETRGDTSLLQLKGEIGNSLVTKSLPVTK
jgi:hypothetical protein